MTRRGKKYYYRVEIFALGSTDGGYWEDFYIVSGSSPEEAYTNALESLRKKGFAFESKVVLCNRNGDDFQ